MLAIARLERILSREPEVRLENVAPGDFDPANNVASSDVRVIRSERIFYSASAEDRTYASETLRRRTYRESTPDTYDWVRTDREAGRVQASVLFGSFPSPLGLPFSAEVSQETGGVVLHAGSYASAAETCVQRWDTAAGVRFALCASSAGGGRTTVGVRAPHGDGDVPLGGDAVPPAAGRRPVAAGLQLE